MENENIVWLPKYKLLNYWCDECGADFKAKTVTELAVTHQEKINADDGLYQYLKDLIDVECPFCHSRKQRHSFFFEDRTINYAVFCAPKERIFKLKKKLETDKDFYNRFSKMNIYPVTKLRDLIDVVICMENILNPNIIKLTTAYLEFKWTKQADKPVMILGNHLEEKDNNLYIVLDIDDGRTIRIVFDYEIYKKMSDRYSERFTFYDTTFFEKEAGRLYSEIHKMTENEHLIANNVPPSQYNTFATYHDLLVKVLFKEDGEMATRSLRGKSCCTYIFEDEENTDGNSFEQMKFSDFYKLVVSKGYQYFCHYWAPYYAWHIDAYEAFTKENLDKFLCTAIGKQKDQYDFLFDNIK